VEVAPKTDKKTVGAPILKAVNVDTEVAVFLRSEIHERSFEDFVLYLSAILDGKEKVANPPVGTQCKSCEFRISDEAKSRGTKCGFDECWIRAKNLKKHELNEPFVFDLWSYSAKKAFEGGTIFLRDLDESDFADEEDSSEPGLSAKARRRLQIQKTKDKDSSTFLDVEGIAGEMRSWKYPLNFIDFETTTVAIPFNKGRRPYEQVAFQFSHHVLTQDGRIEHRNEFINRRRGAFPNFDFVRVLKKALSENDGTIFRYAAHENSILCQIHSQLEASDESDREDLMEWIRTITKSSEKAANPWEGSRAMVDLLDLVKRYYFHPGTGGSNSIKDVLPAVLESSEYLQDRYGKSIYGTPDGPSSKNFKEWQWLKRDEKGRILNPYKTLPPIFTDFDLDTMDSLITEGSIEDGGAAMTAYARMQFTQMTDAERNRVSSALLKYCELDTFAMVMIVEYWAHEVEEAKRRAA
jgi:hypothetical protein